MIRPAALVGTTVVLLAGLVAIANLSPKMQNAGDRKPAERPAPSATPAPMATPEIAEETDTPEPETPPDGPSQAPVETTERHVIHGSGSIGVTSGEVEQGERSGDARATYTGPPRPAPPTP